MAAIPDQPNFETPTDGSGAPTESGTFAEPSGEALGAESAEQVSQAMAADLPADIVALKADTKQSSSEHLRRRPTSASNPPKLAM